MRSAAVARRWSVLLVAVAVLSLAMAACAHLMSGGVTVSVDSSTPIGTSSLSVGVTHGQRSVDPWGDGGARQAATKLLSAGFTYQNQHIYGWGATNPEPSPGHFVWDSLDRRVALMRATGAVPVITLCCAPDWMTSVATPTSTYPNTRPAWKHFDDFAALASAVALRYPDVTHFVVWNEMKGFWDAKAHQWNYVAYTSMYNRVYDALKAVNPKISVGGPYLTIEGTGSGGGSWATAPPISARNQSVLHYWLTHMHGADFIAIDRTLTDFHDQTSYTVGQKLDLTGWSGDVARQIRQMTNLPVWIMENRIGGRSRESAPAQAAITAALLSAEVSGGVSVSLQWAPEEQAAAGAGGTESLWSGTAAAGGGTAYPAYYSYRMFHDAFPPGTPLYRATAGTSAISTVASKSKILLINRVDADTSVRVGGRGLSLAPYEVRLVGRDGLTIMTTAAPAA